MIDYYGVFSLILIILYFFSLKCVYSHYVGSTMIRISYQEYSFQYSNNVKPTVAYRYVVYAWSICALPFLTPIQ